MGPKREGDERGVMVVGCKNGLHRRVGKSEEDKVREVSTVGSEESSSVRGRLQTYAYLSAWVCVNTSAV